MCVAKYGIIRVYEGDTAIGALASEQSFCELPTIVFLVELLENAFVRLQSDPRLSGRIGISARPVIN